MKTTAKIIDFFISIVTGILALALILYSVYVLYDSFSISRNAFSSHDLLQYRPSPDAEDGKLSFQEIMKINPDVVGWLTIYDTNIDYPILQGENNMEYLNKDIYGEFSLSGSIYLASENESSLTDDYSLVYGHNFFSDGYNLIYGHNITGGAMFGDVPKFQNEAFFNSHRRGLIQTPDGENYDLTVFACVETDAYESLIYSMNNRDQSADPELMAYIREHAVHYDLPEGMRIAKLFAFSTCAVTETNGRIVLFAAATLHEGVLPEETDLVSQTRKVKRTAVGHGQAQGAWALLNLICVVLTVLTFCPVGYLRRKYRRLMRRYLLGLLPELLLAVVSILLFLHTENIRLSMAMADAWTPVMILLFAAALLVDFICFGGKSYAHEQE